MITGIKSNRKENTERLDREFPGLRRRWEFDLSLANVSPDYGEITIALLTESLFNVLRNKEARPQTTELQNRVA